MAFRNIRDKFFLRNGSVRSGGHSVKSYQTSEIGGGTNTTYYISSNVPDDNLILDVPASSGYYVFLSPFSLEVNSLGGGCELFMIGGGGSGGGDGRSGGGGAGGILHAQTIDLSGSYTITVGSAGNDSVFSNPSFTLTAEAGGPQGTPGGSGGGGDSTPGPTTAGNAIQNPQPYTGGTATGYGNPGGTGSTSPEFRGAGGGGAGGTGGPGGGAGGSGRSFPQFPAPIISSVSAFPGPETPFFNSAVGTNGTYAGGGGSSGDQSNGSSGGSGGGGRGGGPSTPDPSNPQTAERGIHGTGSGGGGGQGYVPVPSQPPTAPYNYLNGGGGGNGIVIIRFPIIL